MLKVGNLEVTTPSDREIVMRRSFDAPCRLVFEAWTRPDLLRRWLLGPDGWSMTVCEVDLRIGGRYRFVWRHQNGTEMGMGGVYREILAPTRLVTTELFDEDWTGGETLSTVFLTEQAGRTEFRNTVSYSSSEARDGALRTGMADGMEAGFVRLDAILAETQAQEDAEA